MSVGRFATMTHLGVKTLRHYHEVGRREPAEIELAKTQSAVKSLRALFEGAPGQHPVVCRVGRHRQHDAGIPRLQGGYLPRPYAAFNRGEAEISLLGWRSGIPLTLPLREAAR